MPWFSLLAWESSRKEDILYDWFGSKSGFIWLALIWKSGQIIGELAVIDQVLAVLSWLLQRLWPGFQAGCCKGAGQSSVVICGVSIVHRYIKSLSSPFWPFSCLTADQFRHWRSRSSPLGDSSVVPQETVPWDLGLVVPSDETAVVLRHWAVVQRHWAFWRQCRACPPCLSHWSTYRSK